MLKGKSDTSLGSNCFISFLATRMASNLDFSAVGKESQSDSGKRGTAPNTRMVGVSPSGLAVLLMA